VAGNEILERKVVCARFSAEYLPVSDEQLLAISLNVREGARPLNGVRFNPTLDQCGWFIWGGEDMHYEDDNFYNALHASHISNWCPLISKYLGLPPGWRFLVTEDCEDVWFDPDVLD
jgi:hypothetical protein